MTKIITPEYLDNLFEKTIHAFETNGIPLYKAGVAVSYAGLFIEPLQKQHNEWTFRVTLSHIGLEWNMRIIKDDPLSKILFKKVSEKIDVYGYISEKGFYSSGALEPKEVENIDIAGNFFQAVELYNKLLTATEELRGKLYREAEEKYEECITALIEKI